jgi:hypothetical protein
MLPAGFELAIQASERPQTHAVDRAVTGIGLQILNTISITVTTITTDTAIYITTNKVSRPSDIKTNTNIDHTIASAKIALFITASAIYCTSVVDTF